METKQKMLVGRVTGNKMDKTIIVSVAQVRRHPLYKKTIRSTARYKAHDKNNECTLGDTVRIVETRPLSKDKHWRVAEIIGRKEVADIHPRDITEG